MSVSMYQAIIRQFRKQGIPEQKQVTEAEVKRALDSISIKNAGMSEFDGEVAHQIWNETRDNLAGGAVKLKDYISTMVKAQNILKQQVQHIQNLIKSEMDPRRRQQFLSDLFSYSQDHRTLTIPFGIQQIRQSKQIEQSRLHHSIRTANSNYFSMNVDERQQSTDMKIVIVLTLILLVIELVVMFKKHHFFTIFGVFLIIFAFTLNYFQKGYVKLIIIWIAASIIFDIIWVILMTKFYWQIQQYNIRSNLQAIFLKFICVMIYVQMLIKLILVGLLIKYRNIPQNVRKKVNMAGLTFLLDGEPTPHNLFAKILPTSYFNSQQEMGYDQSFQSN